jgi:hypothetical protein
MRRLIKLVVAVNLLAFLGWFFSTYELHDLRGVMPDRAEDLVSDPKDLLRVKSELQKDDTLYREAVDVASFYAWTAIAVSGVNVVLLMAMMRKSQRKGSNGAVADGSIPIA